MHLLRKKKNNEKLNSYVVKRTITQLKACGGFAAIAIAGLVWPVAYGA